MTRWAGVVLAIVVGPGATMAQDPPPGVDGRIAAIARLTLNPASPDSPARLRAGLTDEDSRVRAAAARVAHVMAALPLLHDLRTALEKEPDPDAAHELAWTLADLDPTAGSDVTLKAAVLLPALRPSVIRGLVAGRGPRLISLWADVRTPFEENPEAVIGGIKDGLHDGLGNVLASFALRDGMPRLFEALLTETRVGVEPSVALAALNAPWSRARAASYVFLANRGVPPKVEPFVPRTAETLDERIGLHLFEAMSGKSRSEPMAGLLTALAGEAQVQARALNQYRAARGSIRGLTPDEREGLLRALGVESREIGDARDRKFSPGPAEPGRGFTAGRAVVRTLGGHPRGFMGSVIEASGCQGQGGSFDGVEAGYQPGGRPKTMTRLKTAFSAPGCGEAAQILGRTALSSEGDQLVVAILPERPEFLACIAEPGAPATTWPPPLRTGGKVAEPKKVRNIRPTYPASASERNAQGIVILETVVRESGCVSSIRVLRSVDAVLDLSAIDAVSGWRYEPSFVNGSPVPVVMTVTVNYTRQ